MLTPGQRAMMRPSESYGSSRKMSLLNSSVRNLHKMTIQTPTPQAQASQTTNVQELDDEIPF